jgi:Ca-activated chloride channel family protein
MTRTSPRPIRLLAVALVVGLLATGCSSGKKSASSGDDDPGDCTVIDVAVSSEKIDLMTQLAKDFNASDEAKLSGGTCAYVRPYSKASGGVSEALVAGWDADADGAEPVIWSPAAKSWGAITEQRLKVAGKDSLTDSSAPSFMLTPLTIAMPKPMADALGYPAKPIGWSDIAALANDPAGWAKYGHPEWGAFKLGKTNPNFSTSGLSALIGQNYAAVGKTRDLSSEDLANPATVASNEKVESAVVHYGDITMTFLNNWFRTDRAGTSLTYVSAVAVEEKSVIDYNKGTPDGVAKAGVTPTKPRVPLVAIYPKEGTLYSDNPLYVLKAPWVDATEKAGADKFVTFVQEPENQRKVLTYGFRPGNRAVAVGAPISAQYGVDPKQPATLLQVPQPAVMVDLLERWKQQRRDARVMIVLDVSGSMGDPADPDNGGYDTKLDLAKKAARESLGEFKDSDEVGLRIFTTNLDGNKNYQDIMPIQAMGTHREELGRLIEEQIPRSATPLYDVTSETYDDMVAGYDPTRINAIVLLTDGKNEDDDATNDRAQFSSLLKKLRDANNSENDKPIRIFPIAYGTGADDDTLTSIAEATNAASYSAKDPKTIVKVFTNVISNF